MTDNERLAVWQGHYVTPTRYIMNDGQPGYPLPDYLNDDAAAMSLLDTLVEKGYVPQLSGYRDGWWFYIYANDIKARTVAAANMSTRRAAVCAAVLELIEKEDV